VDEIQFLDQHRADLSPLQRAMVLDLAADAKADAADKLAEAERKAAAQHRAEVLRLGNRQAGDPLGQLQRFRAEYAQADDEVTDLTARLKRAEVKRDRIGEAIQGLAVRVDEITASVSRSAPVVDPGNPFAVGLARAHHEFAEATRARWIEATAARALAPRPKVGRGSVARALGDGRFDVPNCPECIKAGATEAESFLLHSDPDGPVPVPVPEDTDRSAETARLMALGYSWSSAELAAVPYGQEITR
jgi:hypothetical protein